MGSFGCRSDAQYLSGKLLFFFVVTMGKIRGEEPALYQASGQSRLGCCSASNSWEYWLESLLLHFQISSLLMRLEKSLSLCIYVGNREEAPSSRWTISGHFGHLGIEPVGERSLSIFFYRPPASQPFKYINIFEKWCWRRWEVMFI